MKKQQKPHDRKSLNKPHSYPLKNKQLAAKSSTVIEGIISLSSKGVGYVTPTGMEKRKNDIEISFDNLNTALNGDLVKVSGKKVVEILNRAKVGFSGVLEEENGKYFLKPSDAKMYCPTENDTLGSRCDIVIRQGKKTLAKISLTGY